MRHWDSNAPEIAPEFLPYVYGNAAGMDLSELRAVFQNLEEAPYRAVQVFEGIYRHRWLEWDQFTNLSKKLRHKLASKVCIKWPEIEQTLVSGDGTAKHTLKLADGHSVECVYMPYENRATLCISSQVGCAMGCTFCATGTMGLVRNLMPAEIVGQVMTLMSYHKHVTEFPLNVVFMGIGEPLHNLPHVMKAFEILTHANGMVLSPRRITVSTAGLIPGIRQLGEYHPRPRLALSLNATTDDARTKIMPINAAWNLSALTQTLRSFPLDRDERITLEYVLIADISDSMEDAGRLSKIAGQFPCKINLIPCNPCLGSGMSPPDEDRLNEMGSYLAARGHVVSIRRSRGSDIGGACGQLVLGNFPRSCHTD